MYSVMWSEHCSYKSSKVHLRYFGETTTDEMRAAMLAGHRRERRRRRHRRRLGGHLQGRVAQPPVLRRALPGRGHRRRRHRPRHHGDGRPPGRGDGPAALRRGRRPRHPPRARRRGRAASAATATRWACPTSAARPSSTRPTRATRWSTRCASACCARRTCTWRSRPAPATRSSCSARAPAWTASAASRCWRRETFGGDEGGAGPQEAARRVQVGDPFMEKVLIECCLELYAAGLVVGIQDLGGAGLSCATSELASAGDGGMHIELDKVPLRGRRHDARRDPVQRVAGADVRGRHPGERRRVHGGVPQVGGARHRHRRGHRRRPAADHLARRDRRRRAAAHRRARGPGLRAPRRSARTTQDALNADTSAELPRPGDRRRAARDAACAARQSRTCAAARSSPSSTTATCAATPCSPSTPTAACCASTRPPAAASRSSTDASGRYTQLDPYAGAQLALAEAYRNVAVTGATPVAVTNCLNFGSPEDPGVMWQFARPSAASPTAVRRWAFRSPAATSASTTRPGPTAILPDPGGRRARRASTTCSRRIPTGLRHRTRRDADPARRHPRRVRRLDLGAGRARPPRRPARRRSTSGGSGCSPRCSPRRPRDGLVSPRTTCPRAAWPRPSSRPRWPAKPVAASLTFPRRRDPFVALFSESAGRVLVAVRAGTRMRSPRGQRRPACPSSGWAARAVLRWRSRTWEPWTSPSSGRPGRAPCPRSSRHERSGSVGSEGAGGLARRRGGPWACGAAGRGEGEPRRARRRRPRAQRGGPRAALSERSSAWPVRGTPGALPRTSSRLTRAPGSHFVTGRVDWATAVANGALVASGGRAAEIARYLPLGQPRCDEK